MYRLLGLLALLLAALPVAAQDKKEVDLALVLAITPAVVVAAEHRELGPLRRDPRDR